MTYNTMKLIVKTFRIALICFIHSLTEVHRVRYQVDGLYHWSIAQVAANARVLPEGHDPVKRDIMQLAISSG